jgi:DNA polymerase-3 subunit delta'
MPFRDITGHEHLRILISRAASRGSLPPSLIFAGPAGVGKFAAAVALAQLVNCQQPVTVGAGDDRYTDACGECQSCRKILRRVHADVLVVEPGDTGAIKIEQIREAIERTAFRPFEGRRRVIIIDAADAIAPPAQDALLKTLEEPPNATMFVLVTASPEQLLPTIRSRCQRLRFGRLAPAQVADVLRRAHGFNESDAHAAAAQSDGSIGRALEGASEDFISARKAALDLLEIVASSPAPGRRILGAKNLPGGGGKADRDALAQTLRALSSMLRDLGILSARGDDRMLANADLRRKLDGLLRAFDDDRILRGFAAVDRALDALGRNASPKIVADWVAFQL